MKRLGISFLIGLAMQTVVWFAVPNGKFGPCGPADDVGAIKFFLTLPGMLAADWLHIGAEREKLGIAIIFRTPALIYGGISWLGITLVAHFKGKAS